MNGSTRTRLLLQAAARENQSAVAESRQSFVVCREQNGPPFGATERGEQLSDLIPGAGIQISRRFVRENQTGPPDTGARDGDALLLAPGQKPYALRAVIAEADALKQLAGLGHRVASPYAIDKERHRDILGGREVWQEMMKLKDEPDLRVAKTRQLIPARARNIEFTQLDLAAIRRIQPAEQVKQSRFASARWAHDSNHLTRLKRQ